MRIAIVFPSGHLTSTPCIPSLAILLAQKGIQVDVYTAENKTTTKKGSFSIFDGVENLKLYVYPVKSKGFWENIPFLLLGFFPWWVLKVFGRRYDFTIAVGVRALFMVGVYSLFTRQKYIFLSLELYIKKEMNSIKGRIFKSLEGFFNRRAVFSIIQDVQRAKILQRENGAELENILIFPNSSLPLSKNIKSNFVSFSNVAERYSLQGKKIVLYAGSIFARWAMTKKLIKEAENWPDDWILIIHSRANLPEIKKFMPIEQNLENFKVIFSTEPLNEDEYENLVKSSHVGIALYDGEVSENLYYTGYSSGKVAQYLKCGKPIITNRLPLLQELINTYKCGIVIDKIEKVKDAIVEIDRDYESFSYNALVAYQMCLNPEVYIKDILEKLHINIK